MRRTIASNDVFPTCPIRNVVSRIADKWSLLILHSLDLSPRLRFKELRRSIPDISQKMLTSTLRTLEEDGYVSRTVYAEVPPRVEYALTDRAHSLMPHINALASWAADNMEDILRDRKRHVCMVG